jgi:hypothetical protein
MHSCRIFGAKKSHRQTWIHKTHHDLDLREATTFPLIVYSFLSMKPTSKWRFVPRFPNEGPKIRKVQTFAILGSHNFVCRFLIEMKSKAKL